MQSFMRHISIGLIFALAISACGFQLRSIAELSFKNLYIQGVPVSLLRELKQSLKINEVKVVESADQAELLLEFLKETNEKKILSLSGTGVVREYELNYRISFRTRELSSPTWSSPQTLQTRRTFSYNDVNLLGKADEEAMLNLDMHKEAVREVLRRLTAIKPVAN